MPPTFTTKLSGIVLKNTRFCCTEVHEKDEFTCFDRQMGYWANIPDSITTNDKKLIHVETNFDPEVKDSDAKDKMCNCVRDAKTKKCKSNVNVVDNIYPYFSFGTGKSNTHAEQTLLPKIEYVAKDKMTKKEPQSFYLLTYNSPCSRDLDNQGSCSKNIFKSTYDNFFKGNEKEKFHSMNVGFYQWFEYNGTMQQARQLWCDTIEKWKKSEDFKTVDFTGTLKFRKYFKQKGDDGFVKDLNINEC